MAQNRAHRILPTSAESAWSDYRELVRIRTCAPHNACGGTMRSSATLTDPYSRGYADGVGLESRPAPIAPAHPDPQPSLDFAA